MDFLSRNKQQSISRVLPNNVNLLTFEEHVEGTFLIRLEHLYDVDEDANLSQPATVSLDVTSSKHTNTRIENYINCIVLDIQGLFPGFDITKMEEAMLGGNQYSKDSKRLVWTAVEAKNENVQTGKYAGAIHPRVLDVVLQPMEIRTFVINLKKK